MIIVILLIGLFLRLININQSLWLDEAVQAITAQKSFNYIFTEIVGDFHPPLYHFLMHFWVRIFGDSEIAMRMPSVMFGIGTVYLVYLIVKIFFPRIHYSLFNIHYSLPDLVALLMATAPFHVYYSQEARMYSMATFLVAGSMYYFIKVTSDWGLVVSKTKQITNYQPLIAKYFLFTVLMLYSDYYGFLILLAQGIYLLIKKKPKFLILNSCLPVGMAIFIILFYLPWLPMLITQLKTGILATQVLPEWGKLVNLSFLKALPLTFIKFSIGRITIFNKTLYALFGGFFIFVFGLLITKGCFKGKKLLITNHQSLITLWFFVPLLTAWLLSLVVPNFQPFRLLLILPAFYILLFLGILTLKNKTWRILAFCFVISVNLVSLYFYYSNPFFHREDWKGTVTYIQSFNDGIAVLPSVTSSWPWEYYSNSVSGNIKLLSISKGIEQVNEGQTPLIEEKRIYYIRYLVSLYDPQENILRSLEKQGYSKIKEVSFNQIPVWEYRLTD